MTRREDSDEAYVIGLAAEILGETPLTQHRFDWLRGDPGADGRRGATLPVDAYFPEHALVVEYYERQHDEAVAFFDKPDRMTVSGVHRGEQRRRYDQRRVEEIPRHGLRLVIVHAHEFDCDARGRLRRAPETDRVVLQRLLAELSG